MSPNERRFTSISGALTHYARPPVGPYGTRGKATPFACTPAFFSKLERTFAELWSLCPLGPAECIASAGAWVPKPGYHGRGEAFDLDALFWSHRDFVTLRFPSDASFYLAVEAVLRRHFGAVLAYSYNDGHRDHFHVQDSRPVGLSRSARSDILFIQNVATHLLGDPVRVDGKWGPESAGALERLQGALGVTGSLDTVDRWKELLATVSARGFAVEGGTKAPPADTPLERLRAVYRIVEDELGETAARKRIETAITGFAEHPDVQAVVGR